MYIAKETRYDNMKYNYCGASGLKLPAVSLGLWHNFGSNGNFDTMMDMCETAFDNGITHFDLANNYGPYDGAAEENFGCMSKWEKIWQINIKRVDGMKKDNPYLVTDLGRKKSYLV